MKFDGALCHARRNNREVIFEKIRPAANLPVIAA